MGDVDYVRPGDVPMAVQIKKQKEMASMKHQLDFLMKEQKTASQKERIKYNMEKALSMNADISYKDTEDGKVVISVTKDKRPLKMFLITSIKR